MFQPQNNKSLSIFISLKNSGIDVIKNILNSLQNQTNKNFIIYCVQNHYAFSIDEELLNLFNGFNNYFLYPSNFYTYGESFQLLLNRCKTDYFLCINDNTNLEIIKNNNDFIDNNINQIANNNALYFDNEFNYFIADTETLRNKLCGINRNDDSIESIVKDTYERLNKIKIFKNKNEEIIYIDGALGDHICAIPLIRNYNDVTVCCKQPELFKNFLGKNIGKFINWNDENFGGEKYGVSPYLTGMTFNTPTLMEAYTAMYEMPFNNNNFNYTEFDLDILKQIKEQFKSVGKPVALISPFSAGSNKNWNSVGWLEVVEYLKSIGYYVLHIGTSSDEIIPLVDSRIFDHSFDEVACMLKLCDICVCVENFIHHFASCIKTDTITLQTLNNEHAEHNNVNYIKPKNLNIGFNNRWLMDSQQPERKESMKLITVNDVIKEINKISNKKGFLYNELY